MSGRTIYLRKLEKEGMEKRKGCNIPRGTGGRGYKREGKGCIPKEASGRGYGEEGRGYIPKEGGGREYGGKEKNTE